MCLKSIGLAAIGIGVALLSGLAIATEPLRVCLDYKGPGASLLVTIDNGCVSSSRRLLTNDLQVDLAEETALVQIEGGLTYSSAGLVALTDCGAGQFLSYDFPGAKGRRYLVRHGDRQLGIADFSDEAKGKHCFGALRTPPRLRDAYYDEQLMKRHYQMVALQERATTEAPTIKEIFKDLMRLAAKDDDNEDSFELELFNWPLTDNPTTDVFGRFTKYGSFPDGQSGKELVGHFSQSPSGWQIHRLWQRHMCAQGQFAGQWRKKGC